LALKIIFLLFLFPSYLQLYESLADQLTNIIVDAVSAYQDIYRVLVNMKI